ncbi:MAG: two-component sensor histidine kinase [Deltaproteobacteria bacterium]|nr:MAG: two-component sensor histidine kinase [Deltaproteobacteria bacterium]
MKRFGIHLRLLVAVIILICGSTFFFGYVGVNISHQFLQTRFEDRILFLARYLALNAELGILIDEKTMLNRLAQNLLSEKDVMKISILNRTDELLVDVSRHGSVPDSVVEVPVVLKESSCESLAFRLNQDEKPGSKIIGKVRISYTTAGIKNLLKRMKIWFVWVAIVIAGISLLIFYFISRSLVSPVTQLVKVARKVAKGDSELRVKPGSLPETRELAVAFNSMLDSIKLNKMALEDAYYEMSQQKALAQMGKFSLMVAHEVKNPLGIIKSSLDILKGDHHIGSDDMMVFYIEDEINRLNRLIEDFLLFAKPVTPDFRVIDVNEMIQQFLGKSAQLMSEDQLEIESDIQNKPCMIMADPDLLIRAVENIFKNAVRANDKRGIISIASFCAESGWVLEIADQGAGIEPENMDKIFEPFFTTSSKGTGLGLAYVFEVINAHGGRVSAENLKRGGALFRIEIPVSH